MSAHERPDGKAVLAKVNGVLRGVRRQPPALDVANEVTLQIYRMLFRYAESKSIS
jgi:hypothetical protein